MMLMMMLMAVVGGVRGQVLVVRVSMLFVLIMKMMLVA
jgi:hypothetical protein